MDRERIEAIRHRTKRRDEMRLAQDDAGFLLEYVDELEAELKIAKSFHKVDVKELHALRVGRTVTVEYDLTPAMKEGAIRSKLIELGWTPPPDELREKLGGSDD